MILQSIKYCRLKGEKGEWCIEGRPIKNNKSQWLTFEPINLIVGKNASGKTKTVFAIRQIASLLSGEIKPSQLLMNTLSYELKFKGKDKEIYYFLDFKKGKVKQEILKINGVEKLNRKKGELYYEELAEKLSFETDDDLLAVSRRDSKQQPFFEDLFLWGKNVNYYRFGGQLGKDTFVKDNTIKEGDEINLKDTNKVTGVFISGKRRFKDDFVKKIIEDMKTIDYRITKIETKTLKYIPISAFGLGVHEEGLDDFTDQREMSQGMFRALSLIIQLNFSILANKPDCILIDDIGEGLDYERSKKLIDLVIEKSKNTNIQVIMSTNDRFVMNKIPLQYWSVIKRTKNKALFYNYKNSKKIFDDFAFTGLNNFEFFATDFYIKGFEEYTKIVKK